MCFYLHFPDQLNFTKNVTYDLLASTRRLFYPHHLGRMWSKMQFIWVNFRALYLKIEPCIVFVVCLCSQRWARLEDFPLPDFNSPLKSILAYLEQISVASKSDKQKLKKNKIKKGPLLIFIPFPFHLSFPPPL